MPIIGKKRENIDLNILCSLKSTLLVTIVGWGGEWDCLSARYYFQESYDRHTQLDSSRNAALVLANLGNVLFCVDNYPEAQKDYEEGLRRRKAMGDMRGVVRSYQIQVSCTAGCANMILRFALDRKPSTLNDLDLTNNPFASFPTEISNLGNLENLNLDIESIGNGGDVEIPADICNRVNSLGVPLVTCT